MGPVDYQAAGPTTEPFNRTTAQLHLSARTERHSPQSFQPRPADPAITGSTTDAVGTMQVPSTGPSTHLPPLPVPPTQRRSRRYAKRRGLSQYADAIAHGQAACAAVTIRQRSPGRERLWTSSVRRTRRIFRIDAVQTPWPNRPARSNGPETACSRGDHTSPPDSTHVSCVAKVETLGVSETRIRT